MIITKDLTLNEFMKDLREMMASCLYKAATGDEIYRIHPNQDSAFVIMSEAEYNIHHDALRLLLENAAVLPDEVLQKFKPTETD